MKKEYKYCIDVFIPQFIQCNRPMAVIEFDETSSKMRIATKDMVAKIYIPQTINPETVNEEIKNEKTVLVIILLRENNIKDALYKAKNILEEKLAILSFLCGYPCKIMNPGFIIELSPGDEDYQCIPESTKITPIFSSNQINDVSLLFNKPDEKIINSLRWYRKALIDENLIDRFISLWIALEMISSKLKSAGTKFLTCPRCREAIEKCPICGKTTETRPMEKDGIINHIQNNLGIKESEYYTKLNNMRNSIFHGRTTEVKPRDMMTEIQKLKYCLITAYHFLIYGSVPKETSEFIKNFTILNQDIDLLSTLTLSKEGITDIAEKYTYFNVDSNRK